MRRHSGRQAAIGLLTVNEGPALKPRFPLAIGTTIPLRRPNFRNARPYKSMQNLNDFQEFIHEGVRLRRYLDYPMFAVADDGRLLGARGFWLEPASQPTGHKAVAYFTPYGKRHYIHVHRLVALCYVKNPNPAVNIKVDHKDVNPLNNHYTNLRWVTARQNCQNLAKNKTGETTSKYVGVSWKKRERKFFAQIRLDGKNKGLGQFNEAEDAAKAYDRALIRVGLLPVNFPESNI